MTPEREATPPSLYRTIVVGTDGSPRAQRAVQRAAEMAQRFGARLHLVQAYKGVEQTVADAMATGGMVTPTAEVEEAAEEEAAELALGLEAQAALLRDRGVEVETHSVSGSPAPAILETAETVGADLIVVGNRGMTGAKRILGSVPNTLAHHADCAVLIVPTDD
jgi:nucleotide-binding universal stress UspA family protein